MKGLFHLCKSFFDMPLDFDDGQVAQLGRMYCKSDTVVKEHLHTELFELTIVSDGKGIITTNGQNIPVKKGDIYLTLPYDLHMITSDKNDTLKFDFFAFKIKNEEFIQSFDIIVRNFHSSNERIIHNERISAIVSQSIAEVCTQNRFSHELLCAYLKEIMVFIIRAFESISPCTEALSVSSSEALCYDIMNYIDTHLYSMKNLDELAHEYRYSYGYLSSLFKKTVLMSLSEYHQKKKLDVAGLLILEDNMKISEISDLLNYSSPYSFSRAFFNHFGMYPTQYKKQNGKSSPFHLNKK